jgi:hypothetical protein
MIQKSSDPYQNRSIFNISDVFSKLTDMNNDLDHMKYFIQFLLSTDYYFVIISEKEQLHLKTEPCMILNSKKSFIMN